MRGHNITFISGNKKNIPEFSSDSTLYGALITVLPGIVTALSRSLSENG